MSTFKVETKNRVNIDKKPRVYFTCHPDDFERYFKKVCDDIFKTHDCAIYYTEDMTEVIADDEKEIDLGRNNLFVIPVTFKLLTTPNRAMDEDIPYALKEHIPVLPIMMESGIDEFYSKPDKFGELQYLNPYSTDLTEISYEEKLKKHLESILISDELAKRVRAAFDAYIFLSYRKKDRKYANELMRLIHSIPECRDIAIWFDEFLTPGESFKENIEKILDDCKLFTLLVTPQLLEKVVDENGEERDNYVISTELPLARRNKEEKGTEIFAVEMENTDKAALSAINIEDYVNSNDEAFRARLLENIFKLAITSNDKPEHEFLIGLAYFEGIDVEVDIERGLKMMENAGFANVGEAIDMLYNIYSRGIGVKADYAKASMWALKKIAYWSGYYNPKHTKVLESYYDFAEVSRDLKEYDNAIVTGENVYKLGCEKWGEDEPFCLRTLTFLSGIYYLKGDVTEAIRLANQAYQGLCKVSGEEHYDSIRALRYLAMYYVKQNNYEEAIKFLKKNYKLSCEVFGKTHSETIITLEGLALAYQQAGELKKAILIEEQLFILRCEALGEEHLESLEILSRLMYCYQLNNDFEKSAQVGEILYTLRYKSLGEEHPDTLKVAESLVRTYYAWKKYKKAAEYAMILYQSYMHQYGIKDSKTVNAADAYVKSKKKLRKEKFRNFFKRS